MKLLQREPDWSRLVKSWDKQQEEFIPDREQRFDTILDVVEVANPSRRFTALDLGCGPGALASRILRRFPKARVVAVDYDPVVLTIGKTALKKLGKRVTWIEADLGGKGLLEALEPHGRFDAAVSSTAIHWLYPDQLRTLYGNLAQVLRRGAVFVNADPFQWDTRALIELAKEIKELRKGNSTQRWRGWKNWWREVQKDKFFEELFEIRKTRFPEIHSKAKIQPLEFHKNALKKAGFRYIDTIYQNMEDRILVAIR